MNKKIKYFSKLLGLYQKTDVLIEKQKKILEQKLLNYNLSVYEGFNIYSKIENIINNLETNFYNISNFLKRLSVEEKEIIFNYFVDKKSGIDISKENNISTTKFYNHLNSMINKFFILYPSLN